jgi:hypothetical protein
MRRRVQHEGLTVNVVTGNHVVFFGMDLDLRNAVCPAKLLCRPVVALGA